MWPLMQNSGESWNKFNRGGVNNRLLLVENEWSGEEGSGVKQTRVCACHLFISLSSAPSFRLLLLSSSYALAIILHRLLFYATSFNFQGSSSVTATVSDFVEAPLSKTGAATVKRNACMNTGSHVLVPHHFFPFWISLRAITTGSTLFALFSLFAAFQICPECSTDNSTTRLWVFPCNFD